MRHALVCALTLTLVLAAAGIVSAKPALEPWNYSENFEDRTLGAWASYPHWQDIAYDQKFRVNEMVPGDPNISLEQKVYSYTNVDTYAGAQKLLDIFLVPGAKVSFRYYIKYNQPAEYLIVRFAGGTYGKLDVKIPDPAMNRWARVELDYTDFVKENPCIAGEAQVKVYAIATLVKVPDADPDMPIFFGMDDIAVKAARAMQFQFAEPAVYKLPEFSPYIPKSHYIRGAEFMLSGRWPLGADKVTATVATFTDSTDVQLTADLRKQGELWSLKPVKLTWPVGLYAGTLKAFKSGELLSETKFTLHIAPDLARRHPRLLFDADKLAIIKQRLATDKYKSFAESVARNAASQRERVPVSGIIYDLDQFPDENWLPTWSAWGGRIYNTDSALLWNSLAYSFLGDETAGQYAKDVLVKLAEWPDWTHPWQTKRGRFNEHRTGGWSHRLAFAYDLTYDLMTPDESLKIRNAVMGNIVGGAHRTYVYNDNITGKTSNWLAMILGGSLTCQAAMFGDGEDTAGIEPYFTGAALKYWEFINRVTDSPDGAWGEGFGYNSYSFTNMSYSIPTLKNVFNIDMSDPLDISFHEAVWAGPVKDKQYFYFGDSSGGLQSTNWAFLLDETKDPMLSWYYHFLKGNEGVWDVIYDLDSIPEQPPFDKNPVKLFRQVGTTVFKSGWEPDDFIFVMRTGPFINHQHLDQGSFWLADRGSKFMEERHNSTYYDDPIYQSWYIQPIGHSTILINGNHQSQRNGDHSTFAPGFDEYAFISHFLDGTDASFVTGDIGRLYWGEVESMQRNVLYLKPRTLLMLDTIDPAAKDVDVTLLYQTLRLKDIVPGGRESTITKDGTALHFMHLAPEYVRAEAVETPHYLYTLQREKPLVKEGMLTVTARTTGVPLVMANLLTTTPEGTGASVTTTPGKGCVTGASGGTNFVFSTKPGAMYAAAGLETDALACAWKSESRILAAQFTALRKNGALLVASNKPITAEVTGTIKYYHCVKDEVAFGRMSQPKTVTVNGAVVKDWRWDAERMAVVVNLPAGEGTVSME